MHGNARLTPEGRRILVERIASGRPPAHVAAEMGVSRTTAYRWWRRYQAEGTAGLVDRPSRPRWCPHRTSAALEARVIELRQTRKLGPARIGMILGMPASTVHRVLVRYGMNRLAWMDRPSGRVIRRYEKTRPGELIHVDIKKLGRIPTGGGWRAHGRGPGIARGRGRTGYGYIHAAIDDHSRLVYAEVLADEKATTAVSFLQRAATWLNEHGITIDTVMTDNGACYRSHLWADTLQANSIRHLRTRPHRPQTNGKIERWFRTLTDECIYTRPHQSEHQRTAALADWIHTHNHHRHHTAIGGPPITRIHNPAGQHT